MPTDLKLLRKSGCTQAVLKKFFTKKNGAYVDDKARKFADRLRDRIKEGIEQNQRDYRIFHAIDTAYDSAFYQTTKSLLMDLVGRKRDTKDVLNLMKDWNISDIGWSCGCGTRNCSNAGCTQKKSLDIPIFTEVLVPIVRAYTNVITAKIFNDRNLNPLLKYHPAVSTADDRLRCDIITSRVEMQGRQMNHNAMLRQFILQSIQYSECITFPQEAWYSDEQPLEINEDGKVTKRKTVKEGIRYAHPHPSRTYRDLAHPVYTLNTGTGCNFAGYWQVVRYGDVADNEEYWNRKEITFGQDSFRITDTNTGFFQTVYPCVMRFPSLNSENASITVGEIDREKRYAKYTRQEDDSAVLMTYHFERLNPKTMGWGSYDGDVDFRFIVSSDDTVNYCEPVPYRPMTFFGCDTDANRFRNAGVALEVVPYQDMIGNFLSQAIATAKSNLLKFIFADTSKVDEETIKVAENRGEKVYRVPNFIRWNGEQSKWTLQGESRGKAFEEVQFVTQSTAESINLIATMLNILDRILGLSPQEVGASASHEQSATETRVIAQNMSTRRAFTAGYTDDGIDAWMKQLYDAGMSFWDDQIVAEIALENEADKERLKKLGFKVDTMDESEFKAGVRGSKSALGVEGFTTRRDAPDRMNNPALVAAMTQLFQPFINNPALIQSIGVKQVVDTFNMFFSVAGLPRDFKLRVVSDPFKKMEEQQAQQAGDVAEQLKQLLPQIAEQTQKSIAESQKQTVEFITKEVGAAFQEAAKVDAAQQANIDALAQQQQQAQQAIEQLLALAAAAQQPAQPMMPQQVAP